MSIASKTGQVRFLKAGDAGPAGPIAYPAGEYNANTKYTRTELSVPILLDDGEYYLLNKIGTFKGIRPKDDYAANGSNATWIRMDSIKYAFIEILMANFAKLASAVFYQNVMMSQQGVDSNGQDSSDYHKYNQFVLNPSGGEAIRAFTPNLLFDFMTGAGHLAKGNIKFGADGSVTAKNLKSANESFVIDENGDVKVIGKVSTSVNGTSIEIDPDKNSIVMYNQNQKEVMKMSFMTETWNGTTNYYPRIDVRKYNGDSVVGLMDILPDTISGISYSGSDSYQMTLSNKNGLSFYKNGQQTKNYPSS